ncbi:MAG: hypothetical protein IJS78_01295 [Clostridia bacterium]|nr:hypothetical protein [Clostridia bacterium]
MKRKESVPDNDVVEVFDHIWKGGYTDVQNTTGELAQTYYQSYIDNYAEIKGFYNSLPKL